MHPFSRLSRSVPWLLGLFTVFYVTLFTRLAFIFHAAMRTNKADLGQIAQAVWNSSRGRFLENTDVGVIATRLTDHVEPLLVLISPLFWLWNDVRLLLLLQVVAIGAGAFLLYDLALYLLGQLSIQKDDMAQWLALIFALAYLLTPQLQHAVLTEFHAAPLATPLILWALGATLRQRWRQFCWATLLLVGVKEEMALVAVGLGVWAIAGELYRQYFRPAPHWQGHNQTSRSMIWPLILLTSICLGWFVLATFVIVPANAIKIYAEPESVYFQRYGALGSSPLAILRTLLTDPATVWSVVRQPARLDYLWGLLAPFGFLSLLAPDLLLLSLPLLMANLFSQYPGQYYNEFHYSAPLLPFVAVSAVYGVYRLLWLARTLTKRLSNRSRLWLSAAAVLWALIWGVVYYAQAGRGPLGGRYDPLRINEHHRLLPRFLAQIPSTAAVTATSAVHPHLSLRRYVYQFPLGLATPTPADWALLDITTKNDMAPGDLYATVQQMLAEDWGVVDAADGFLLLARGRAEKIIPAAFYDFGRTPPALLQSLQESGRQFHCAADDWARWRETNLVIDQRLVIDQQLGGAPVAANSALIVAPSGEVQYDMLALPAPASIWFPPELAQQAAALRYTTIPLYLPRMWGVLLRRPADDLWMSQDGRQGLLCAFARLPDDRLLQLPANLGAEAEFGNRLGELLGVKVSETRAWFRTASGQELGVRAWLAQRPVWGKDSVDVWLQWQGQSWPQPYTGFVHLRQNGENRAQADGAPRYFTFYAVEQALQRQGYANDWRQMQLPADATVLTESENSWSVVIGLYDPQTNQRALVIDALSNAIGNELTVGNLQVGSPPTPDQTCAMIEQSCAAQW